MKHVKANFVFYLLLACNFDIIYYTILSSLSKNHMIKPEIKKKKKMSGMISWMGGGGVTRGVLAGARPRAYLLISVDSSHKCFTFFFNFAKQDKMRKDH